MKYLLDTDVLSQTTKAQPNPAVMAWLASIPAEDLRISAITIEEIRLGSESMPEGRKRREIEEWLDRDIVLGLKDRILPIDAQVANACGRIVVAAIKQVHNASLEDALIAATANVHHLRVATLNRRHFKSLSVELVDL